MDKLSNLSDESNILPLMQHKQKSYSLQW